jgi:hypothetical protein
MILRVDLLLKNDKSHRSDEAPASSYLSWQTPA